MNKTTSNKKGAQERFDDEFIQEVIAAVEANNAPWQKGWAAGEMNTPMNAQNGSFYSGRNAARLFLKAEQEGYLDPRWATAKQIGEMGGRITKGEKGTGILWYGEKHVIDKETDELKIVPIVRHYHVFNICQTNLPVMEIAPKRELTTDLQAFADLIAAHNPKMSIGEPAYRPSNDTIYLPSKSSFHSDAEYYATALHEMSHWSGHPDRLNRDLHHQFGTPGYAKEELIAELSSYMLSLEHGLPFKPNNSEAYLQHWANKTGDSLENALLEGFKGATSAKNFLTAPLKEREQSQEKSETTEKSIEASASIADKPILTEKISQSEQQPVGLAPQNITVSKFWQGFQHRENEQEIYQKILAEKPHYLAVPYEERQEAKSLGAKWDSANRCWYAPPNANRDLLEKWSAQADLTSTSSGKDLSDFAYAAGSIGLDMNHFNPTFGTWHRTRLDQKGDHNKDGAYKLFQNPDGTIGAIARNLSTGEQITWSNREFEHNKVSAEIRQAQVMNQKMHTEAQYEMRRIVVTQRSKTALELYSQLPNARGDEPYLVNKGIKNTHGIKRLDDGSIVIPLINGERVGNLSNSRVGITSLQVISPEGEKRLMTQGNKQGSYFPLGNPEARKNPSHVFLAEGVATAEAILQIMRPIHGDNILVIAAVDSGNLRHVANKIQQMYPNATKTIAADNDIATEQKVGHNPGINAAKSIISKYPNVNILIPDTNGQNTDWNDVLKRDGLETTIATIAAIHFPQSALQIDTTGKNEREIGKMVYEAIRGDVSRIPEVKTALKSQGYSFNEQCLTGINPNPITMKEAFSKAVSKQRDVAQEQMNHSR